MKAEVGHGFKVLGVLREVSCFMVGNTIGVGALQLSSCVLWLCCCWSILEKPRTVKKREKAMSSSNNIEDIIIVKKREL